LISYTANPTTQRYRPGLPSDSQLLPLNLTSVGSATYVDFNYALLYDTLVQEPTLRGTAQQICVNFGAVALANAVALNGVITWSEE